MKWRMERNWVGGNRLELLENGEEYYPRLFEKINAAEREVMIETFIIFEDKVGIALRDVLVAAARRGVSVDLTFDSFGSPDLSREYLASLVDAGVRVHIFDHKPRLFGLLRIHMFHRLHRKLCVIDGKLGFIGGINYSADHLGDFGPEAKLDHAAQVEGPIVTTMHDFMHRKLREGKDKSSHKGLRQRWHDRARKADARTAANTRSANSSIQATPPAGNAEALLVTRDNAKHTNDIERHYCLAIRAARERVVIANAYFFPGYRLVFQLCRAARRGVAVSLILQGKPDMMIVKTAAGMLHHRLLRAGVRIFEYCEQPMHSKVAIVDDQWATIGSSNLDPLSLSLNLEANLMVRDRDFNAQLSARFDYLMQHSCREVTSDQLSKSRFWLSIRGFFEYHLMRHFPAWLGLLPAHKPTLMAAAAVLHERPEKKLPVINNGDGDGNDDGLSSLDEADSPPQRSAA